MKQQMLKNKLPYNISTLSTLYSSLNSNEVGIIHNGMDSVTKMQILMGSSGYSNKSRKSQNSKNNKGVQNGIWPTFGNYVDNFYEENTVLNLTNEPNHEFDDDKKSHKSHKSNQSHISPQSQKSYNEH